MFNFFNLSLRLNGFPIKEASAEFEKILAVSENEYSNYVNQKKKEIVEYHLKHNKSYQAFVGKTSFDNWNELPVMTKKEFQKPLSDRLSEGYTPSTVYVNKTSGSSGDPFVFAKDKFCHALTWSTIIHRFSWFGIDFNSSLQARFYGIPLDFIGNKKERIKDFLSNRYRFTIFDLSDVVLEKVLLKFVENIQEPNEYFYLSDDYLYVFIEYLMIC